MALHSKMDYKEKMTIKRLAFKDELGVVKERHELGGEIGCCVDLLSGADKSKKFPLAHRTSEKANYLSGRKTCLPVFFFSKIKNTLLYTLHSLKFGHRV